MYSSLLPALFVLQLVINIEALLEDLDKKVGSCVVGNPKVRRSLEKEQLFVLAFTVRFVVNEVVNVNMNTVADGIAFNDETIVVNGKKLVDSHSRSSEALIRDGVHSRLRNELVSSTVWFDFFLEPSLAEGTEA